jgi:hypothetical protein
MLSLGRLYSVEAVKPAFELSEHQAGHHEPSFLILQSPNQYFAKYRS